MKTNITIGRPCWLDRICSLPITAYRYWKYGYSYRRIPVGEGQFALVDPKEFYWLNNFNWCIKKKDRCSYAIRFLNVGKGKLRIISMHRNIMDAPKGSIVDHRNNEGLDNRRGNLRFATSSENVQNRRKTLNKTSSRFLGVSWKKKTGQWYASIKVNKKTISLGYFDNEVEAAKTYDCAVIKYFSKFARLNFPENSQSPSK